MTHPISIAAQAAHLPDAQRLAVLALVAGRSRAEVAAEAGIGERTLRRWLQDPVFLAAPPRDCNMACARTGAFPPARYLDPRPPHDPSAHGDPPAGRPVPPGQSGRDYASGPPRA